MTSNNTIAAADFLPPSRARYEGQAFHDAVTPGAESGAGPLPEGLVSAPLERPIQMPQQDLLGRADLVRRLARTLVAADGLRSRGVAVGLTGPSGSGKTSLLNLLDHELQERRPRPIIIRFNPWLVSGRDMLISEFLTTLAAVLGAERRFEDAAGQAADLIQGYMAHLNGAPGFAGAALAVPDETGATGYGSGYGATLHERRHAISDALSRIEVPIIVLIDEVDQLDPVELAGMAQLIRAVADFDQISFVLTYDEAYVIEALGHDAPFGQEAIRGRSLLEKVVQLQIPVPQAGPDDIRALLDAELRPVLADLGSAVALVGEPRFEDLIATVLPGPVLTTPRDIKRLVSHVRALAPLIGSDVDLADVVGFCALMAKAPDLAAAVRAKPERYVLDPDTDDELRRRLELPLAVDGEGDDSEPLELAHVPAGIALLHRFLFPVHVKPGEITEIAKNRICFQRPLMDVIRLGRSAPDAPVTPESHLELLSAERDTVASTLLGAVADGSLDRLLTRLAETYPLAKSVDDEAIWAGILDALLVLQSGDAARGPAIAPSTGSQLVDILAHLFERRALSAAGFPAAAILSSFVAEGEWNLSAALLRPCWAQARMTRHHGTEPMAPASLEPEEARNLAFQYAMHARAAHIKGEFLPGLLSLSPVLLLIDMAVWDTQWQSGFQQMVVNNPSTVGSRLLELMFADGDTLDPRLRGRIVGNEELLGHLEQLWRSTRRHANAAQ